MVVGPLFTAPFLTETRPADTVTTPTWLTGNMSNSSLEMSLAGSDQFSWSPPIVYRTVGGDSATTAQPFVTVPDLVKLTFHYSYIFAGSLLVIAGLLFLGVGVYTGGPMFLQQGPGISLSNLKPEKLGGNLRKRWGQKVYLGTTFSLVAVFILVQTGLWTTYQTLVFTYVVRGGGWRKASACYLLAAHYAGHLVGRALGGVKGAIHGPTQVLLLSMLSLIVVFVAQLFLGLQYQVSKLQFSNVGSKKRAKQEEKKQQQKETKKQTKGKLPSIDKFVILSLNSAVHPIYSEKCGGGAFWGIGHRFAELSGHTMVHPLIAYVNNSYVPIFSTPWD